MSTKRFLTEEDEVRIKDELSASAGATEKQAAQIEQNTADINQLSEAVAVERARIDAFTSLPEGATTGDAELADAKIDKDGNTHANVGEHIRTVTRQLSKENVALSSRVETLEEGGINETVEVDTSLTQTGMAADAKATGDAIRSLRKTKNVLKLIGADGNTYEVYVDADGTVKARIYTGDTLTEYTVFVPENVSDEWNTGGTGSSTQAKTLDMTTEEFLELFYDGFVSSPPTDIAVTKKSIGKDQSGQYDMWEYTFEPYEYSRTILLSSGMHTYELSASFGLANFIGHLYTDTDNEAFEYIRKNVRIKVIPIVNPWGFNQNPKTYGNVNGVNPNRNFDLDGAWSSFPVYTPTQNEWNVKGSAPFTEAEVINLAKWALDNWDAEFWIDCHTGLGYSDKDLWVYYMSDSPILDRINGGISKIETWFKETYGSNCVTTRTIDSDGSIRLHWGEQVAGIAGMTLEQAPHRTTFGTSANNDSGDISNYSTNISTFVQEFLLEKYRSTSVVEISSVSASDVTMDSDELSKTVEVTISPTDTTQNHFKWTSSNENVVEVYGGTNKAVLAKKGTGTTTITLTNRYNSSIKASFEVTVEGLDSYTITNNLTNVISDNDITSMEANSPYVANLTTNDGYVIYNVKIVMGGNDITSTAYSDGIVNIASVTGNIVITASATLVATSTNLGVESGSISKDGTLTENSARFRTGFIEVEHEVVSEEVDYELSMVSVSSSNGTETESTTRCSTSYIPLGEYDAISVEFSVYHSYLIRCYKYENGEYTFIGTGGGIWYTKNYNFGYLPSGTTHIRLTFRGDSNGTSTITNINPSDTRITLFKSLAIDMKLGDTYSYYIRLYNSNFEIDTSIVGIIKLTTSFITDSVYDGEINSNNSIYGNGTLKVATLNTAKYIKLIGMVSSDSTSVIDVSTLTGNITINGVEYDLAT